MKFDLGRLTVTHGVFNKIESDEQFLNFIMTSIGRYCACDWGDLSINDKEANAIAVTKGDERILATYTSKDSNAKIWIITESDRSATTVLFPEEY